MTRPLAPLTTHDQRVVVVGAGIAGLRVVESLCEAGFPGRVTLVSDELHEPYDRPPLSKAVLEAEAHEATIGLSQPGALAALNVDLRLGATIVEIDRQSRRVRMAQGEWLDFDRLVLATGSRVRTLPSLPAGSPGVYYLRGLSDARALRAALGPGRRLAVVGGGVIGLEVAATARRLGCDVTVIEAAGRLMARAASSPISEYFRRRHADAGVDLKLGVTVSAVERPPTGGLRLRLSDGGALDPELVVVGIGVAPNAELASASGLAMQDGGVLVDSQGATSDPHIYAAGEVAAHYNDVLGAHDRQETWNHAAVHGAHVGAALMGVQPPYSQLPSYWSDQYDINLMIEGQPRGEVDVVRGEPASGKFLVFHLVGAGVVGVSAVNSARELRAARRVIGHPADPVALADPAVPLASLLAA